MAKDKKNSSSKSPEKKTNKGKKRKSAPEAAGLNGLLGQLQTVTDLRRQVGQLSAGQVVVGGVALLAAGLTYWAKQRASTTSPTRVAPAASPAPSPVVEEQPSQVEPEVAAVTPKKKAKARKKVE